jgi:hypothetical protein
MYQNWVVSDNINRVKYLQPRVAAELREGLRDPLAKVRHARVECGDPCPAAVPVRHNADLSGGRVDGQGR